MSIRDWFCKHSRGPTKKQGLPNVSTSTPCPPCKMPEKEIHKLIKAKLTVYDCNRKSIDNYIEGGSTREVLFRAGKSSSVYPVTFTVLPGVEPFAVGKYILEIGKDTLEGEFFPVMLMKENEAFCTYYHLPWVFRETKFLVYQPNN